MGFPGGSDGKESTCNAGDLASIPGLGRSPGGGDGYPLQCSGLENSMDCTVHRVSKSRTRLSGFHFHSSVGSLLLSSGPWYAQDFVCALQDWSLCFPQSCESPIIKSHWLSKPDSLGIPRLGSLTWGSEPTQQWENFFGIIFLQFVGHPLTGYGI